MWDIFKIFKSTKDVEQEKLLSEKKVAQLKAEIKLIDEKASALSAISREKETKKEKELNDICPKCRSTEVNDRIKRQQGEIKGDFEGSSWSALTFGSSSSSGTIRGSMDTNEVNKCNKCNHEWKKYKYNWKWNSEILKDKVNYVFYYLKESYDYDNCKFDPLDVEEKFNSLEEKKADLLKNPTWRAHNLKEFWGGISLDTINYLAPKNLDYYYKEDWKKYYNEEKLLSAGFVK